jgi:uncharacterized membrane protein YdfJ with MMPL/SSD domain
MLSRRAVIAPTYLGSLAMATRDTNSYEDIRYVLKKEMKKPTVYAQNRKQAMLERALKFHGERGLKEIAKEFKI